MGTSRPDVIVKLIKGKSIYIKKLDTLILRRLGKRSKNFENKLY